MGIRFVALLALSVVWSGICPSFAQEADVASLKAQLQSGDVAGQVAAARGLAKLGANAAPALPAVMAAINSDSAEVRGAAILAASAMGGVADAAVPTIVGKLKDQDPGVRAYAAHALGRIGVSNEATLEALVHAALDPDKTVRREVLTALRHLNAPREVTFPIWAKALRDADPQVVTTALDTVTELGKDALPLLTEALADDEVSYWACLALAEIGPDAAGATPQIVRIIRHPLPQYRLQALATLGEIGPGAAAAVPSILTLLQSEPEDSVRYAAAFALGHIGQASDDVIAALRKLNASDDLGLRVISAWNLLLLNADDPDDALRRTIIAGLTADQQEIRSVAVRALRDLKPQEGGPSDDVILAFVTALENASPEVVVQVIDALASRGADSVPALKRGLKNDQLRPYALSVLIRLGADGAGMVGDVVELLNDPTLPAEVRREAHFALAAIGSASAPAVKSLIKDLESDVPEVRHSACYALAQIGPAASEALRPLVRLTQGDDSFSKLVGAWAALKIAPENPRLREMAVPLLTNALSDERAMVRLKAAETLGSLGADAKSAVAALQAAAQDEDADVSAAAKQALAAIGVN